MPTGRTITESIYLDSLCEVDEANGVIKNARVLGARSPNCHDIPGVTQGTEYTRAAMESGLPLYEGAMVCFDHPNRQNPNAERLSGEPLGKLRKPRVVVTNGEPEVRADIEYYRTHPKAPTLIEDVKRKIGNFGLSHNALTGKASVREGKYVVETLDKVHSVDVVTRPATNKNLWESIEGKTVKITLKQVLEAQKKKLGKLPPLCRRLLEMDDMPMLDAAGETAADGPDHDQAIDDGFAGALKSLVDSYMAGKLDMSGAISKFKQLIKSHGKLKDGMNGGGSADTDNDGDTDADTDNDGDAQESLKLKRSNATLKCLLEAGIQKPSPTLVKALEALDSDDERKALLKEHKPAGGPKSSVPGHNQNTVESKVPASAEEFAKSIRD